MKELNTYIIEKLKIDKDSKVISEPVLLVSSDEANSYKNCSFDYYEIDSISGDKLKLKDCDGDFKIVNIPERDKENGTWGIIYAIRVNEKPKNNWGDFNYVYKKDAAITVIKKSLAAYPRTFSMYNDFRRIEKPIQLRTDDSISNDEWLKTLLKWFEEGKKTEKITEKLHIDKDSNKKLFHPESLNELSNIIDTRIKESKDGNINLTDIDVSKITDMHNLFFNKTNIKSINVSGWDVSNVTNMNMTFYNIGDVEEIKGLDTWDVSNVTEMYQLFYGNNILKHLDIKNWDVQNVERMERIFRYCKKLEDPDLTNWTLNKNVALYNAFDDANFNYKIKGNKLVRI